MRRKKIALLESLHQTKENHRAVLFKYRRIANNTHFERKTLMARQTTASLCTLPVQFIHRIFDNMDEATLCLSCCGVCQRLNNILDTYKRYEVIFHFISSPILRYTISFSKKVSFWYLSSCQSGTIEVLKAVAFYQFFYWF